MEKRDSRVRFISSLSTKMALIVLLCVTLSVSLSSILALNRMEIFVEDIVKNYALTMAETAVNNMDSAERGGVELNSEVCTSMVSHIKMIGVDSSYIYLCDSDGTMIYHPTESKIGKKVENESVKAVVDELQSGKNPEASAIIYDYNGVKKLAAYSITSSKKIVVLTADYDEVMDEVSSASLQVNVLNSILIVIFAILGYIICRIFLKPIPQIVKIVEDTAAFDFRRHPEMYKLVDRKDELGLVMKAIHQMRRSLREIATNLGEASEALTGNISELTNGANQVNSMCTDNSSSTQEIAAGMQETSATTETIASNINIMLGNAKDIDGLAVDGTSLSGEVSKRANELKNVTIESTRRTENIYASVKAKADSAIENAKVVDKINEMTNQIMEISSQTSLLALNASIEAARAGESGKGFAVVATEIGNLATQSANTVTDIDEMVKGVVDAVSQMQECLEETTSFIGENVIKDYKEFENVSDQYDNDANKFKDSMEEIRKGITELNSTIGTVAKSVSDINTTINEAAHGVTAIAENTSDIVLKTENTAEKANDCTNQIQVLDDIIAKFTLEK